MVYKFFDKKAKGSGIANNNKQNLQLAKELLKPILETLKKEQFILDLKIISGVQV